METSILGTNGKEKGTKNREYRLFRVKVNLGEKELMRYAELAIQAGFRPKGQKLFKESKRTGKTTVDMKGIGKWVREAVVPEYEAHAWEREQKLAEALRKRQEADDELAKYGQPQTLRKGSI